MHCSTCGEQFRYVFGVTYYSIKGTRLCRQCYGKQKTKTLNSEMYDFIYGSLIELDFPIIERTSLLEKLNVGNAITLFTKNQGVIEGKIQDKSKFHNWIKVNEELFFECEIDYVQ